MVSDAWDDVDGNVERRGANVEGDLEADMIIHTFALSKDENKV